MFLLFQVLLQRSVLMEVLHCYEQPEIPFLYNFCVNGIITGLLAGIANSALASSDLL
jgi:hypothetical protein